MARQGRISARGWRLAAVAILGIAGVAAAGWLADSRPARAEDTAASASDDSTLQETAPARTFISEIVDSSYFVGPAEFFALDLPVVTRGGRAVHLFGDVQVQGRGRDVIVRLFRSSDYQDWLKKRAGKEGKPMWTSPRSRSIHIDQALPAGVPVVLLLDNGYSIRTPKQVRVQIQIQYAEDGAAVTSAGEPQAAPASPVEGDVVPRSNAADDTPPPPPPPPPGDGSN